MKTAIVTLFLFFIFTPSWSAETKNYCKDAEGWKKWINLIEKNPNDDDLRAVYSLRIGLCSEIDAKTIDADRAIKIFDRFFQALKWQVEIREQQAAKEKKEKESL